jgi:hypothetical protein
MLRRAESNDFFAAREAAKQSKDLLRIGLTNLLRPRKKVRRKTAVRK